MLKPSHILLCVFSVRDELGETVRKTEASDLEVEEYFSDL